MQLEVEERKGELEWRLRDEFERRYGEERRAADERQETALHALRNAAAGRELELQNDYQAVIETQQSELESLARAVRAADSAKPKRDAPAGAAQDQGAGGEPGAGVAAVAGLEALRDQAKPPTGESPRSRRNARRTTARFERATPRRSRASGGSTRSASPPRTSAASSRPGRSKRDSGRPGSSARPRSAPTRPVLRSWRPPGSPRRPPRRRISSALSRALDGRSRTWRTGSPRLRSPSKSPSSLRNELEEELAEFRRRAESGEPLRTGGSRDGQELEDEQNGRLRELDAEKLLAEEKIADLEARLRETQEENRRNAERLEETLESLERLSDPERRLRDGIALFNASEHARAVASISKALGLPRVHAALTASAPGQARSHASRGERWPGAVTSRILPKVWRNPGSTSPERATIRPRSTVPNGNPNARMDAQGKLTLGVQAR